MPGPGKPRKKSRLNSILAFADGASSGNPGSGGWGVAIAYPDGRVEERGGHERDVTNNQMELRAALEALRAIGDWPGKIELFTDSTYVIRGITQWIWGWRSREWKTAEGKEVSNRPLWEQLLIATLRRKAAGPVQWCYVPGHSGVPGNERVDAIAAGFAQGKRPSLYRGMLLQYEYPIHDLPEEGFELPPMRDSRTAGTKPEQPHCYLSLVNGKLERHPDWKSCEARVKGRPGAKFKKAMSPADEARILKDWGI